MTQEGNDLRPAEFVPTGVELGAQPGDADRHAEIGAITAMFDTADPAAIRDKGFTGFADRLTALQSGTEVELLVPEPVTEAYLQGVIAHWEGLGHSDGDEEVAYYLLGEDDREPVTYGDLLRSLRQDLVALGEESDGDISVDEALRNLADGRVLPGSQPDGSMPLSFEE